jgi:hypothetical protein
MCLCEIFLYPKLYVRLYVETRSRLRCANYTAFLQYVVSGDSLLAPFIAADRCTHSIN